MNKRFFSILIGCALFAVPIVVYAAPDIPTGTPDARASTAIVIPPHSTHATIERTVIRGEYACYTLVARKGQRLDTTLNDGPDENIFMSVFLPGYRIVPNKYTGIYEPTGRSLPGMDNGSGEKEAHLILPASGKYILCLGTGKGGAGHYQMTLTVR